MEIHILAVGRINGYRATAFIHSLKIIYSIVVISERVSSMDPEHYCVYQRVKKNRKKYITENG
jgi:hypothetical protein